MYNFFNFFLQTIGILKVNIYYFVQQFPVKEFIMNTHFSISTTVTKLVPYSIYKNDQEIDENNILIMI